ncbi:MAG TPA: AsmA-like C-terminal region-containing protein [Steroidobacteraceae bacterium]|nr:AsmA-like C-terminal region-containing protein [Steroidobacteraceae bacterium]
MNRWLRFTLAGVIGVVALAVVALVTYRLALARVPQYRAALERLVRARTGLDVRFNQLALTWGWRGPEAVFRRVELGEPGRSQVLLRASALIVDFDAWHALQSGHLEAGRLTLVAPDIDVTRLQEAPAQRAAARASASARSSGAELLARWPNGRLDVEDATVTVPDPAHPARTLRFGARRATLERSASSWSLYAQVLLPQRLGRAASLALELSAHAHPAASSGTLSLEGRGLQLGGWREILSALAPTATELPSSGVGNLKLDLAFANGRLSHAVAEVHADEVSVREDLPLGRVRGTFHLMRTPEGGWRLRAERAELGPFESASFDLDSIDGTRIARLDASAEGRIEDVMGFIRRSPVQGLALAARSIKARGRAVFHLDAASGDGGPARLSILVRADSVQVAPQLPPLESVSGTLTLRSGHLLPSTLAARWLGGALALHLSERERGEPAVRVQAEGVLDARSLVAATGIDTGGARVAGRTAWRGELVWDPAADVWRARADASFRDIASDLPDPLAKPNGQRAPFHIELAASSGTAMARVAGEGVQGAFELKEAADGLWLVRRGALRFGSHSAELAANDFGPDGELELRGTLDSLDLPAWILAWRTLSAAPQALPVRAQLEVGELTLAGQRYPHVALDARTGQGAEPGFDLELDSRDLTGEIRWPKTVTPDTPVEVHLERIGMEDPGAPLALAPVLAALGAAAEVQADQVVWGGRSLGALTAHVETRASALLIEPLRLTGEAQDLEATVRCRSTGLCRAKFELASHDAATTLRDFGFRADVASENAVLKGDLQWPRDLAPLEPAWLASLAGSLSVELANGTVREAPQDPGVPFALLGVPALLGEAPAPLDFSRLSADYSVRDGSATTSDLHFDGAAEILLDGRIGLTTRDYDCTAWILQGGARLPQALRSFVSAPRVAAAWLALRDLISGAGDSGAELRLRGSWDEPQVRIDRSTPDPHARALIPPIGPTR